MGQNVLDSPCKYEPLCITVIMRFYNYYNNNKNLILLKIITMMSTAV